MMGFFLSRKPDDNDHNSTHSADRGVVQVLRARFHYGRNKEKGKGREDSPLRSFSAVAPTAAMLADPPPPPAKTIKTSKSTSFLNTRSRVKSAYESSPLNPFSSKTSPKPPPKMSEPSSSSAPHTPAKPPPAELPSYSQPSVQRRPADSVSATLAQRLNELAAANSDGLLSDDEYRMLRQNLFERFASASTVPAEHHVVPHARRAPRSEPASESRASRLSTQFVADTPSRTPSLRSRASNTSGMTDLLRRATSNHKPSSGSRDYSETSSMFSSTSASSLFRLPRKLTKKSSNSSMQTNTSVTAADTASISSKRTHRHDHGRAPSENGTSPTSPISTRSSSRRHKVPPSAFHTNKYASTVHNVFDEANLQTSQQILREISSVEAEADRLMDAFHGLELSTLTKRSGGTRPNTLIVSESGIPDGSTVTLTPDRRNRRRGDSDVASIQSGTSGHTAKSGLHVKRSGSLLTGRSSSRPGSLHRKNSLSSISSGKAPMSMHGGLAPPVPAIPALGSLGQASTSSLNLARSTGHLPMASVPEDDYRSSEDLEALDGEMKEIRQRREEVSKRYEARLEYLQAKLKGAQLHEKLMRK